MTRCDRCHQRLTRPPIVFAGLRLGPVCARVLGYVPPSRERAATTRKQAAPRLPRGMRDPALFGRRPRAKVADPMQPELFDSPAPGSWDALQAAIGGVSLYMPDEVRA